jgi:hypothetical protein
MYDNLILGIHTMSIWFGLKTGCDRELQEEDGVCEFYHEDPYIEVEGSFHRLN